jgi:hypothetical protein
MDFADPVRHAGVEEAPLGSSRLTCIDVRDDPDVPDSSQRLQQHFRQSPRFSALKACRLG